jgi:hypothetical protein
MRLTVFDLDDTLVRTDAKVLISGPMGPIALTPAEYSVFRKRPGDVEDFSQFNDESILHAAEELHPAFPRLRGLVESGSHVAIVTAREREAVVHKFLESRGVHLRSEMVHAVNGSGYAGSTIPERKAHAFSVLVGMGYVDIVYYDDCAHNLSHARGTCEVLGASIECVHVKNT